MNKSERERYIEALINPQTAIDWEMAAWDKRSPLNKAITEMAIEGAILSEFFEILIMRRDVELARETTTHEQSMRDLIDEDAARLLRGQIINTRVHVQRPEPSGKDFALEASIASLEKRLSSLREEIPGLEDTIASCKKELHEIDRGWKERQSSAAEKYVSNLSEKLTDAGIELPNPLNEDDKKSLQEAYQATSPAKILAVNPGLAESPDVNVTAIANKTDLFRQLRVVMSLYRIVHKVKEGDDPDACVLPSKLNAFAKLPVDMVSTIDRTDILKSFVPAKMMAASQNRLNYIRGEEKLLNEFKDKLMAHKEPEANVNEVDKTNNHRPF